jgi:hypothetical protein
MAMIQEMKNQQYQMPRKLLHMLHLSEEPMQHLQHLLQWRFRRHYIPFLDGTTVQLQQLLAQSQQSIMQPLLLQMIG